MDKFLREKKNLTALLVSEFFILKWSQNVSLFSVPSERGEVTFIMHVLGFTVPLTFFVSPPRTPRPSLVPAYFQFSQRGEATALRAETQVTLLGEEMTPGRSRGPEGDAAPCGEVFTASSSRVAGTGCGQMAEVEPQEHGGVACVTLGL